MKTMTILGARHLVRRWLVLGSLCGGVMMSLTSAVHAQSPVPEDGFTNVIVNGMRLSDDDVSAIEHRYRVHVPDGSYWYDKLSGAWGLEGGPTFGITLPGLELGGPLQEDASAGNTGVFINGRELHGLDVAGLQQLLQVPIPQGRYWLDAYGNVWDEWGRYLLNLIQVARAVGAQAGGAWSDTSRNTGASVGGDGKGFLFYNDGSTSWSNG